MTELHTIAPAFIDMAHRIVWATVATVAPTGEPRTRVLHPIWRWEDAELVGWIATTPTALKVRHLAGERRVSLTYWDATHDTCTADCDSRWLDDEAERATAWDRFLNAPSPVGYDPSIIADWTSPSSPNFGVIELRPTRLRVFPGTLLNLGEGSLLTWQRDQSA